MAYQDDKIIKAQSPVLFSALHCSAFFFIIIPIIFHWLSHHYYKNLQTKRGHPLLIIQTMCNAALRQLNAVQLKSRKLHKGRPFSFSKWLSTKKEKKKKNSEKKSQLTLQSKVFLFIQVTGDAHHQRFFRAINNLRREVIFKLAEP